MNELQDKAQSLIDKVLNQWESDYFANASTAPLTLEDAEKEPKWIYYTQHHSTTLEPPQVIFKTIFSQPTQTKPVPRATATVVFSYTPNGLSYQFEWGNLSHSVDNPTSIGNPSKRLKEIIKSKEELALKF